MLLFWYFLTLKNVLAKLLFVLTSKALNPWNAMNSEKAKGDSIWIGEKVYVWL